MLICAIVAVNCHADTFVVTSNADSGPGTLRQALTYAAANGNSVTDMITFNLPADNQTINVLSALPAITSPVIIDGTTQPGAAIASNGAKITIVGPGTGSTANCFEVHDVSDFEIYGLVIKDFYFLLSSAGMMTGDAAISLQGIIGKAIIGAPGKGNVIYDNGTAISNAPVNGSTINVTYCEMKDNYIGVTENATAYTANVGASVILSYTQQALIGGNTAAEGNVIYGNFTISSYLDGTSGILSNNIFGATSDYVENPIFSATNTQVYLNSNITNAKEVTSYILTDNVFATLLSVTGFAYISLTVQSNIWGQSPDGSKSMPIPGPAISLSGLTGTVLIGGPGNSYANTFTKCVNNQTNITNGDAVVEAAQASTVELSHNSFFCNNNLPFEYMNTTQANQPMFVNLNTVTAAGASGTTKPNARVELFYTDRECTKCEPQTYIASVNADASGNWVYNGAISSYFNVIAGATLNKISSEFSDPAIDDSQYKVQNVGCTSLGSITGISVTNAKQAQWYNVLDQPVGPPGLNLTNAPAGTYYLLLSQFGCWLKSPIYVINDDRPALDQSGVTIDSAMCGLANGSITGLKPTNYTLLQWLDASGNVIYSPTADLVDVPAGNYTLRLSGIDCYLDYPFHVGNTQDVITLSTASTQIIPDECGQRQGSIQNISVSGGVVPLSYSWADANGKVVSTMDQATGLAAGNYTLTVTDASCGTAQQTFTVGNESENISPPQANNIKVCGSNTILTVNNVQKGYSYKLYGDNVSSSPLQVTSSGVFYVTVPSNTSFYVSAVLGTCESTRTQVTVTHGNDFGTIPTAFSPNGDGVNDYWQIDGLAAYPQAHVQIFNRYGQELYQSKGYSIPWDGTYKGSPLPAGTYYYIITLGSDACNILSGYVAIIR